MSKIGGYSPWPQPLGPQSSEPIKGSSEIPASSISNEAWWQLAIRLRNDIQARLVTDKELGKDPKHDEYVMMRVLSAYQDVVDQVEQLNPRTEKDKKIVEELKKIIKEINEKLNDPPGLSQHAREKCEMLESKLNEMLNASR